MPLKTRGFKLEESPGPSNFKARTSIRQRECQRSTHSEGAAISGNIMVAFGQVAGETVMSVSLADEIEKLRIRGMTGRFQSTLARGGNWPGRQTRKTIC